MGRTHKCNAIPRCFCPQAACPENQTECIYNIKWQQGNKYIMCSQICERYLWIVNVLLWPSVYIQICAYLSTCNYLFTCSSFPLEYKNLKTWTCIILVFAALAAGNFVSQHIVNEQWMTERSMKYQWVWKDFTEALYLVLNTD